MYAKVTTPDAREFDLPFDGAPSFGASIFGGYDLASLPVLLTPSQRRRIRGSVLEIMGTRGCVWKGIPTLRPTLRERLECQGWGFGGTYGRRGGFFAHNAVGDWKRRTRRYVSQNIGVTIEPDSVTFAFKGGGTTHPANSYSGIVLYIPPTSAGAIEFDYERPNTAFGVTLTKGARLTSWSNGEDFDSSSVSELVADGSGSYEGSYSGSFSGTALEAITLNAFVNTEATYEGDDVLVTLSNIVVRGVAGVTSSLASAIVADIAADEFDGFTADVPEELDYIEADSTDLEGFAHYYSSATDKLSEICRITGHDFGWYMEWVGGNRQECLAHYSARPAEPDYILDVRTALSDGVREVGLEPLASVAAVTWRDKWGQDRVREIEDTDTSHYLVRMGIRKLIEVPVPTRTWQAAETLGNLFLADAGRDRVQGSETVDALKTIDGADVYLPSVRPGRVVRLTGLDGDDIDAVIRRPQCTGETLLRMDLDNSPYRLDTELERLGLK
jgi:hypothetical protein